MKTFEEIVHYRRSVRHYQNVEIDAEKVKHCIERSEEHTSELQSQR